MTPEEALLELVNKSVITYRGASYWGNDDYRCVEILMEMQVFKEMEILLGNIEGRLGKQYEGQSQFVK